MKKMKKTGKTLLSLLACAAAAVALAGCSLFPRASSPVFPYDVAVENGYTGTEGSWLAAQEEETHEHALYEEAKASGSFEGTFLEFLAELAKIGYAPADPAYGAQLALRSAVKVETSAGQGAGVIYAVQQAEGEGYPDLLILTNHHVVYGTRGLSGQILCYLYGGETESRALLATCVGASSRYDIAVLRVDGDTSIAFGGNNLHKNGEVILESGACAVTIGDSDAVCAGEAAFAVGNPDGQGLSVTEGVVSVTSEYVYIADDAGDPVSMLEMRTDATVNHGNSGGGFFNARGELIGIVNARSEKEGVEAFGYAIPVNRVVAVAENLIARAAEGKTGVAVANLGCTFETADSRSVYDEDTGKCYLSESVVAGNVNVFSAAYRSGLRTGDTVLSVTLRSSSGTVKRAVTRLHILEDMLLAARAGDTLVLETSRDGGTEITFTLSDSNFTVEQ